MLGGFPYQYQRFLWGFKHQNRGFNGNHGPRRQLMPADSHEPTKDFGGVDFIQTTEV
jgi:hypothetical protein